MAEILKTTFLLRRGLAEAWERNNPVLSCGEPGFVIDQNKLKIGDGQTAWNDLPYQNTIFESDENSITLEDGIIKLFGFDAAEIGAKPQKGANGQIEWVLPTTDNFEDLSETVTTLSKEVANLSGNFNQIETKLDEVDSNLSTFIEETNQKFEQKTDEINNINNDLIIKKGYDVFLKPAGTLVRYDEKEIRIMCPSNTEWTFQNPGATGNANMHYLGFKAYAPEDAESFKEDMKYPIEDQTIHTFDESFSGIEPNGAKYSLIWLAAANYDGSSWTYYGANSTVNKYIGWNYAVEWYNKEGTLIKSDLMRINLANEDCYNTMTPYYVANLTSTTIEELKPYIDNQIENIEIKTMDGGVVE